MNKTICHGGEKIIRAPRFGTGNAYNDFGLGFYCCEQSVYAAECAVSTGRNGFVSSYSIDTDGLRIINLCSSQYNVLHWLDLLLNFRVFPDTSSLVHQAKEYLGRYYAVDFQGSDCIIGYRADGVGFALASDFLSGRLSYQGLARALIGNPSMRQFVLKSNRAFDRISFTGYEPALSSEHYPARAARELKILKQAQSSGKSLRTEVLGSGISAQAESFDSGMLQNTEALVPGSAAQAKARSLDKPEDTEPQVLIGAMQAKDQGLGKPEDTEPQVLVGAVQAKTRSLGRPGRAASTRSELFVDQLIKEDIKPYDLRLQI